MPGSGLAWWLIGKESACQCRRHRFYSWSRKIPTCPRAKEQLSLCATTIEHVQPILWNEKPPQWEACSPPTQLESSLCSPQLEKILCSSRDLAQPKIKWKKCLALGVTLFSFACLKNLELYCLLKTNRLEKNHTGWKTVGKRSENKKRSCNFRVRTAPPAPPTSCPWHLAFLAISLPSPTLKFYPVTPSGLGNLNLDSSKH